MATLLQQPRASSSLDVTSSTGIAIYRLYNPFTGKTVLLPELDAIIGEVAETFEIRKVLMQRPSSSSTLVSDNDDDQLLVAITTNSYYYNIIICRPGKGTACCVLPNIDVFDVVFHGDSRLYGITPEEELVALDLAEDDKARCAHCY